MRNTNVLLLFLAMMVCMMVTTNGAPLAKDSTEIVIEKIDRINEKLAEVQPSVAGISSGRDLQSSRSAQRNYPVYYVTSKVNGKFGKSLRSFTSEEFDAID